MAVETKPETPEGAVAEEVVVAEVEAPAEKAVVDEPAIEAQKPPNNPTLEGAIAANAAEEGGEKKAAEGKPATILQVVSFKEESNIVADLDDTEKKALDELKQLVQAALANNEFSPPPPPPPPSPPAPVADVSVPVKDAKTVEERTPPSKEEEPEAQAPVEQKAEAVEDDGAKTVKAIEETVVSVAAATAVESTNPEKEEEKAVVPPAAAAPPPEEVFIWGVPLLGDERSDTVLLKFLRARDFKAKDAMAMLKNAVLWRKEFGIEALLEEDLGIPEMERVVFMRGTDKEGHPVCYNVYGEFQNRELYAAAFADDEKKKRFLRWRIQYLEKGIRELLDFKPGGVSTMVQVTDLKNSIGLAKKELRQALDLLQDNYPEFAAKQIFINVPWWYLAFNRMISPFFTQRTKSKFVFAGPSKSAEILLKYIAPEKVPVQFGGLSKENDPDFSTSEVVTEITIKPSTKQVIEVPVSEACVLVWELRVLGWGVTYGAEFIPSAEDGYTLIVHKARKLVAADEPVQRSSFKVSEAGMVVLTVNNATSRKKKLLYRYRKSSTA